MSDYSSINPPCRSFLIALLAVVVVAALATGQPFYYEVRYAGATPGVNDWAVTSTKEQAPWPILQGIFADFSTGGEPDADNSAAVLDAGYHLRFANSFYPTGQMAIAKVSVSSGGPLIDFYLPVNWHPNYLNRQELPGPGANSDNTVRQWQIPTASGNAVQAMDIACGIADPNQPHMITSYLITAEFSNVTGTIWLVAYALTDPAGNIVQPYLMNGFDTNVQGTCLGLTTSPGRMSGFLNDRTLNEIMYVTTDPVNGLFARAEPFDVRTALFGSQAIPPIPSTYTVPWPLPGSTIAGIWIAQDNPLNPMLAHHVGISIPNQQTPTNPGTLVVFQASTQPTGQAPIVQGGLGGGPLSHVPWGHNPGGGLCGGPAFAIFGQNGGPGGPGPTGWYVVTPWSPGQTAIRAVDTAGIAQAYYAYPQNAVPNGTPLAHPAEVSLSGAPTSAARGILWVPYYDPLAGSYWLDLRMGGNPGSVNFALANHTVGSGIAPPGNFGVLPPLPKRVGLPWPGTVILPDQKTNFKAEYSLGLFGF